MTRARNERPSPTDPSNKDHHLWRNGRLWWIAFTFHTHEGRKHRVRRSLGTGAVELARERRDALLAQYAARPGWRLALRFVPPGAHEQETSEREPALHPCRGTPGFRVQPLSA
ncbi:MAG: hypothetical protein EXS08_04085 [Planctomycetes bacterium]|nr:hypothetical protein [Planctomycetota bacterium]